MSLLNIGITAISANKTALNTISHNIANVNTPGYSRQSVAFEAIAGQDRGVGFIGRGVAVSTVIRHYSQLLDRQSNAANATSTADAARFDGLNRMQDIFSGGEQGLGAAISSMMNAFADVQSAPADATARNVALTRMSELAARFRAASDSLDEQDYSVKQEIANNAGLVTSLAAEVATLNGQISRALASGHTPNDLLDARDELIRKINKYVQVSTVQADFGQVSLFIGGSQPLVMGTSSAAIEVGLSRDFPGSGNQSLFFTFQGSEPVELTAALVGGGSVGGLLKFSNEDLAEGRNLLGRLAVVISHEMNLQNARGLNLRGEAGGKLFDLKNIDIQGYTNLPGYGTPAVPAATISLGQGATMQDGKPVPHAHLLKPSDYRITFDKTAGGQAIVITRLSDGHVYREPQTFPAAADAEFTLDGLVFKLPQATLDAAADANRPILFQPFGAAAKEFKSLLHNPDDLAAASMLTANISSTNKGTLQLTNVGMARLPADLAQLTTLEMGSTSATVAGYGTAAAPAVKVAVDSPASQQPGAYTLAFDRAGGRLTLTAAGGGAPVSVAQAWPATADATISLGGVRLTIPQATLNAAADGNTVDVTLTARPGAATIPDTSKPWAIVFTGERGYQFGEIDQPGTPPTLKNPSFVQGQPYISGNTLTINGWNITMTGTPRPGDFVTVGRTRDLGDGYKLNAGNAAAFLELRDRETYDSGTTFSDGFSAAMATVGARTQSAKYASEFSATVAKSLESDRSAISGVDKDEEAARLLQYQQAYQASAKVIQTAQAVFDSLLHAVGGR